MATITASTPTSSIVAAATIVPRRGAGASSLVLGLPVIARRGGRVRCSAEEKPAAGVNTTMGAPLLAAATTVASSGPALALVDERLNTEGTGLSLGLSNNLLGWILLGVFALIWALYFIYTSTLEEDEESGLSL